MKHVVIVYIFSFCFFSSCTKYKKNEKTDFNPNIELRLVGCSFPERSPLPLLFVNNKKSVDNLYATLTNNTKDTIRIWNNDCSWGYSIFQVEYLNDNSKIVKSIPIQNCWDSNYPRITKIVPGGTFIVNLNLKVSENVCDGGWVNSPIYYHINKKPFKKEGRLEMRAVLEIKADKETAEHNIWTGVIHSSTHEFVLYSN